MDLRMEAAESTGVSLRRSTSPTTSDARDLQAARQFEGYLLKMLLGEMRKTVQPGGLFEDKATEGYNAILYDALAQRAAEAGSFGLADQMVRQWESMR